MEVATVFLETSLGTRLAVSFPASATTVADLKRRVGDEHAAAFPHIGHIAVQSIKVKQGGSLYLLTDSMAVRDAFRGVTGAWHLQLQVHALPRPHSALHVASTCKHSSQPCVPACHQHQHDSPSRTFAAFGLRSSIGIPGNNMCNAANTKQDAPCVEQLNPCSQMQLEEKETWTSKEAHSSSQQEAMQHNARQKEPLTATLLCGGKTSSQRTDHPPPPPCAAESTKEGGYSENEAMRCKVDENEPLTLTAKVCSGEASSNGTHLPPPCAAESTKEGDSSEEEAIKHKVEEKVCNSESSSNWTDPSPGDESMNEDDSSENEVMQHEAEEKEPWTDSVCKGGGSSHWDDPIEWTDAEQRAWEMALEKRRRPRIAVRKMPNSRAAKLYGYS